MSDENFKLDERLANDCIQLGELPCSQLLLMNNALLPWFVLVPRVDVTEFYELQFDEQVLLLKEINVISGFVKSQFKVDKLNVATIGNIVRQMHIHIVGRYIGDYCWPGVVWGAPSEEMYSDKSLASIRETFQAYIKAEF